MEQKKIIIFQDNIAVIGGVETHLYNLAYALRNYYDVSVIYNQCPNTLHIERLKEIVDVIKYNPAITYECDICIRNSLYWIIPENIIAKRYIEILHADYEWLSDKVIANEWDKAEKIGCGEYVAKQYKKIKHLDSDVKWIRNVLAPKKKLEKVYHFISATRLDKYKGLNRMLKLADMLRDNNIKFEWTIFTNSVIDLKLPQEFRVCKNQFDMFDYVADADYSVLLSDAEGLPYTIQESLQYGTPCIVTDIGGCTELIKDGINGYVVPLDMNFDINKIKHIPKFEEYKGTPIEQWLDELGGAYYINKPLRRAKKMKVKVIKQFKDATNNNKLINVDSIYECDEDRATMLIQKGYAVAIEEEIKEVKVERAVAEETKEVAVEKKVAVKKAPAKKKTNAKK